MQASDFFYMSCITTAIDISSNMWLWHTWKWIKVLHCIFLPAAFSFLQRQVELCLVVIIIANSDSFVPSCVPWSQTAMHQVREPWGQAQDLLLNTFEFFYTSLIDPVPLTSGLQWQHVGLADKNTRNTMIFCSLLKLSLSLSGGQLLKHVTETNIIFACDYFVSLFLHFLFNKRKKYWTNCKT